MPYVNIKITREGTTKAQKAAVVKGVTDVLVDVLGKDPDGVYIVIDEVALEDWGVSGQLVDDLRQEKAAKG